MNYSLVGKARIAAKNAMQSKTARSGTGVRGEMLCKWVKGHVNKPLMVV